MMFQNDDFIANRGRKTATRRSNFDRVVVAVGQLAAILIVALSHVWMLMMILTTQPATRVYLCVDIIFHIFLIYCFSYQSAAKTLNEPSALFCEVSSPDTNGSEWMFVRETGSENNTVSSIDISEHKQYQQTVISYLTDPLLFRLVKLRPVFSWKAGKHDTGRGACESKWSHAR